MEQQGKKVHVHLGVALPCCLFDLACFFFPFSLTYIYMYINVRCTVYVYVYVSSSLFSWPRSCVSHSRAVLARYSCLQATSRPCLSKSVRDAWVLHVHVHVHVHVVCFVVNTPVLTMYAVRCVYSVTQTGNIIYYYNYCLLYYTHTGIVSRVCV